MGIIPSTTEETHLTDCANIDTYDVTSDTYTCSIESLDNAAMIYYFNTNCIGNKGCDINMSSFVLDDPTSICNQ